MSLRLTSSALALAVMAGPAFADVTPTQVWQAWVDYYTAHGYTVDEGSREEAGDALTINDLTLSMKTTSGEAASDVSIVFPSVELTTTGGGDVRTVYSDESSATISGTSPDGDQYSLPIKLRSPGNEMITSGTLEEMTHEFTYPSVELEFTTITTGSGEEPLPVKLTALNTSGKFETSAGDDTTEYTYDAKTDSLTFNADITRDDGHFRLDGAIEDVSADGNAKLPTGTDFGDETLLNAALRNGLSTEGKASFGSIVANFNFSVPDESAGPDAPAGDPQTGNGNVTAAGVQLAFDMSDDGIGYQTSSDATAIELTTSDLPQTISYAVESSAFDLQFPLLASEDAQPFKVAYSLTGLTFADAVWDLFDPQKALPRDPASLDIDLTGDLDVKQDLLLVDENAAANPDAAQPFDLRNIDINQFALNLLGANASVEGKLKVPPGGTIDAPVGKIDGTFEGVNGLIDNLVTAGLIPQDQSMMAHMMLGMFARQDPSDENRMTTEIEFREDGSIIANGQQIK